MRTSTHVDEIISSKVLWVPVYMMRHLTPFRLGYSSMNQFSTIIPNGITFRIVMKPSHDYLLSNTNQ